MNKRSLFFAIFLLALSLLLASCGYTDNTESTGSSFESLSEQSYCESVLDSTISKILETDFSVSTAVSAEPEFYGKWEIKEFCDGARYCDLYDDPKYIKENSPGAILEVTSDGILFLDVLYHSDSPFFSYELRMSDICVWCGYLDPKKVPLAEDKSYKLFSLSVQGDVVQHAPNDFHLFSFCMYEENKLFVGIGNICYFTAERVVE